MDIDVFPPGEDEREFYCNMGKFFASRSVRKELPYLSNSDATTWVVISENEDIIAFSAFEVFKSKIELKHAYVLPEHRNKGIYEQMIDIRMELLSSVTLPITVAVANHDNASRFKGRGFEVEKVTKNYTFMRRNVKTQ